MKKENEERAKEEVRIVQEDHGHEITPSSFPPSSFTLPPSPLPPRAFAFAVRIVKLCQVLDSSPGVNRTLARQILRSGTSIGANIEEGQAAQSQADFVSKYSIACKEARETLYWLKLLAASGCIEPDKLLSLQKESDELVSILTTIVKKAKRRG